MLTCRLLGGTPTTSSPRSWMSPSSGSSNPATMRIVVVLPQPDGPSSVRNSPSRMSIDRSSTATTSPKVFVTPRMLIAGVGSLIVRSSFPGAQGPEFVDGHARLGLQTPLREEAPDLGGHDDDHGHNEDHDRDGDHRR